MADRGSVDERLAPHDFVTDFVWALRALYDQPAVALVSVLLWVIPTLVPYHKGQGLSIGVVGTLALALFYFRWCGVERMFFLYRREGRTLTPTELLTSSPPLMGRFLRLGILVGVVVIPMFVIGSRLIAMYGGNATPASLAAAARIETIVIMVPLDLALTFVPAALVFTTPSARRALRMGLAMIRETWPRSALYAVCPPLALNMLNAIYPTDIRIVRVLTSAGLALLALAAKGATTAFYLRERPASSAIAAAAPPRADS